MILTRSPAINTATSKTIFVQYLRRVTNLNALAAALLLATGRLVFQLQFELIHSFVERFASTWFATRSVSRKAPNWGRT